MTLVQKEKRTLGYYVRRLTANRFSIFTVLCLITGVFVLLEYKLNGTGLICKGDAVVQHYPALAYYGEFLREIIRTLVTEHRLVIPAWDMNIGYGGEIVTTLHYYCLGDPLTLISVFFSEKDTELCYSLLVIIRIYLAGIAMLCYCRHRGTAVYSSVAGAIAYSFCGYAVSAGIFHPFFATPLVYFPLLLWGAELIFEKKTPFVFIASVALSLLSNFYFFYMQVIFVVLYVLLRYIPIYGKIRIKEFISVMMRFFIFAVAGMLVAMPVFLPNIISLLQSDRVSVDRIIPLFYPDSYYEALPEGIVSVFGSYYVYLSISAVAVVALFTMLSKFRKENIPLIIAVTVLLSFLLLPRVGSVFNGFNYVTNRWVWAIAFVFGYITAKIMPVAENLKFRNVLGIIGCTAGFFLLCYLPDRKLSDQTVISLVIAVISIVFITLVSIRLIPKKVFRAVIVLLVVVTVSVNGYYQASPDHGNLVGVNLATGDTYKRYFDSVVSEVDKLPNDAEGRYDSARGLTDYNTALLYDIGGTGFYFSTINPGTAQFQRAQMLNISTDQQFHNIDGRSYLEAALSVSYYVTKENSAHPWPYGYDIKEADQIYSSETSLPLVYVFDSVYTPAENMTVTQRQQMLLQAAMTDEKTDLPEAEPEFTDYNVNFTVKNTENMTFTDNGFIVGQKDAKMTLEFESVRNSELYCIFEGLEFAPADTSTETRIEFASAKVRQTLQYKTPLNNYTTNRQDFLVNLGYNKDGRTEITIKFKNPGEFTFDKFYVSAQPMDDFAMYVNRLANSGVSDINVNKDVITFSANRNQAGVACVSVPYQDGWTATVNGEKAEVFRIQDGLCGVYLAQGESEVVLEYKNPVSTVSFILFFAGIALTATAVVVNLKTRKKNEE
jgi:uncharacterized membrane protein YfhO